MHLLREEWATVYIVFFKKKYIFSIEKVEPKVLVDLKQVACFPVSQNPEC